MSARDSIRTQRLEGGIAMLDDVRSLVSARIDALEEERARQSSEQLTVGDALELLCNIERIEELRDMHARISRLRARIAGPLHEEPRG